MLYFVRWERKRSKCFFTYIYLNLFRSHPLIFNIKFLSPNIIFPINWSVWLLFYTTTIIGIAGITQARKCWTVKNKTWQHVFRCIAFNHSGLRTSRLKCYASKLQNMHYSTINCTKSNTFSLTSKAYHWLWIFTHLLKLSYIFLKF